MQRVLRQPEQQVTTLGPATTGCYKPSELSLRILCTEICPADIVPNRTRYPPADLRRHGVLHEEPAGFGAGQIVGRGEVLRTGATSKGTESGCITLFAAILGASVTF